MARKKFVFKTRTEWSDRSEHSPTKTGQLPSVAVLPTGERIEVDAYTIQGAVWTRNVPFRGYVNLGHDISAKESDWGNDGRHSYGRADAKVEVLAPEGTKFLFEQVCNVCGDFLAEIPENDLALNGCTPEAFCKGCAAVIAEQDTLMEEARQEAQCNA